MRRQAWIGEGEKEARRGVKDERLERERERQRERESKGMEGKEDMR